VIANASTGDFRDYRYRYRVVVLWLLLILAAVHSLRRRYRDCYGVFGLLQSLESVDILWISKRGQAKTFTLYIRYQFVVTLGNHVTYVCLLIATLVHHLHCCSLGEPFPG
jgi:hypothetical protein